MAQKWWRYLPRPPACAELLYRVGEQRWRPRDTAWSRARSQRSRYGWHGALTLPQRGEADVPLKAADFIARSVSKPRARQGFAAAEGPGYGGLSARPRRLPRSWMGYAV
jgi:hypothetical protein